MKTENIVKFLQTAYTDEKLAALLAHAQDGKLAYNSCCCFIGVATADHALEIGRDKRGAHYPTPDVIHIHRAKELPFADAAEYEFYGLGLTDEKRREKLIPLILAEMERRAQQPHDPDGEEDETDSDEQPIGDYENGLAQFGQHGYSR